MVFEVRVCISVLIQSLLTGPASFQISIPMQAHELGEVQLLRD
jgi:hypothetical protein